MLLIIAFYYSNKEMVFWYCSVYLNFVLKLTTFIKSDCSTSSSSLSLCFHQFNSKVDLRPKPLSCFYDLFLLIHEKRVLYKVLLRSVPFSRSYEVTKFWIRRKWRHPWEYRKHYIFGFLCIFLLILWRKNLLQTSMVFLTIFDELVNLQSFE